MKVFDLILKLIRATKANWFINVRHIGNNTRKLKYTSYNRNSKIDQKINAVVISIIRLTK